MKKVRALALILVSGAAIATIASFYLADTGLNSVTIQPASSLPTGHAFDLTDMASSITRPNGNASLRAGVALARVKMAKGFGNRLKVDLAWLDPQDAADVLNNPNAQLYVSLYHPVAQTVSATNCASTNQYNSTIALIVDNLGAGNVNYCTEVDQSAKGSLMTSTGQLVITRSNIAGFLSSSLSDPDPGNSSNDCSATNNHTWCHPTALDSTTNVLWVAMTIVTPGGKPAGQQNLINSLTFFTQAKSL